MAEASFIFLIMSLKNNQFGENNNFWRLSGIFITTIILSLALIYLLVRYAGLAV